MLARNFKTSAELNILPWELNAAITVLGMLERGEIHHVFDIAKVEGQCFNMGCTVYEIECGTIACIGGWMALVGGLKGSEVLRYVNGRGSSRALKSLFYGCIAEEVKISQAAEALCNFLTTGDPKWDEVVGQHVVNYRPSISFSLQLTAHYQARRGA